MENLVCALVEKQFVTTFPGAVQLQLTGRVFTKMLGGLKGQLRAGEKGHWASSWSLWGGGLQGSLSVCWALNSSTQACHVLGLARAHCSLPNQPPHCTGQGEDGQSWPGNDQPEAMKQE